MLPTLEDYELLAGGRSVFTLLPLAGASESEYAAWTIYNRYYLNHFTIAVITLKI
jgi:hypothetical protein